MLVALAQNFVRSSTAHLTIAYKSVWIMKKHFALIWEKRFWQIKKALVTAGYKSWRIIKDFCWLIRLDLQHILYRAAPAYMLKPGKNISMASEAVLLTYYTVIHHVRARNTTRWIPCIIQEITILLTKTFCFCPTLLNGSDKEFLSSVHDRGYETANFKYYFYLLQKDISAGQKLLSKYIQGLLSVSVFWVFLW